MKRGLVALAAVLALAVGSGLAASPAAAATQVIVTPSNTHGWTSAEPVATTKDGGAVSFVLDPNPPGWPHRGALQLTTPLLPLSAKVQYMHQAATPLANVTDLSYYTKQVSGPVIADPSYQIQLCLGGATPTSCSGFTTLVYEPYHNGVVSPGIWQWWDVDEGRFWSSRTTPCGPGIGQGVMAGGGGAPFYTLPVIKLLCPNAVVIAFGLNVGTDNPGYVVRSDLFNFNGTVYNFEPDQTQECKKHGRGAFDNDRGEHSNFSFKHCDNDTDGRDEDSFESSDRGDGRDFHSTSASSTYDPTTGALTMTGIGSTTGGVPVSFVMVALPTTAATPGWVSVTYGDGYTTAGDLLDGEVVLD